jgi:hypothetical protein
LMIRRCLVRYLVGLVMSFNAIQMRMPSEFKGSFTLVNRVRFSDDWSQLHVWLNGRSMWRLSWRISINIWIWVCRSCQMLPALMWIQPLMCIHSLVGFCKNMRIRHLLALHYPTLRWIRKMWLQSLMLNPARMSLVFILMLVHIVGLMMQEILLTQNHPSKCRSNTTFSFVIRLWFRSFVPMPSLIAI